MLRALKLPEGWQRSGRFGGIGRPILGKDSVLALLMAAMLLLGSCAKRTPTLNLLVWEGYADPSLFSCFRSS